MQEEKIVATLVDDEAERMEFLPHHLGNQLFRGMNVPFEWMGRLRWRHVAVLQPQ